MKTTKFKQRILLTSALTLAPCFIALSEAKALNLKVTEIMYDQYSEYQTDYNWIEFQYLGDTDIDLSNYYFATSRPGKTASQTRCFNPFDSSCVSQEDLETMQQSNIPLTSTIISPGDVFVMYGSVVRDARNDWGNGGLRPFTPMWDPDGTQDINFITTYWPDCGVFHRPWCGIGITPGGSPTVQFGFYELEDREAADINDFSQAVFEFTFENPEKLIGSTFPESNNSASIYLTDLSADPNDGSNWALSSVGVDGAYAIEANTLRGRIEPGVDVGSPGFVPTDPENVPEPVTILGSITALGFGTLFKNKNKKKK